MTEPDEDFVATWAVLEPRFASAEGNPTLSVRATSEASSEGPKVDGLPLLSVASEGSASELVTQKLLGKGGMGKVELAIQRSLGREVAIKSTLGKEGGQKAQALLQEARFTGLLEHPNIVPVHQLGRSADDRPLLVMKRVEGVSWAELIRDAAHPHWEILGEDRLYEHVAILIAVCNAVEFAHSRGILHRDMKPENVMVGAFGEVYLLDWGLAMRTDEPGGPEVVGTPVMMAPEMLEGSASVTERTDVYLLGACLHMALTGQARHQGSSMMNVCYAACRSEPVDYPDDVPGELAALCNRATHVDSEQRPESAAAFRRELELYLEHRTSIALASETEPKLAQLRELLTTSDPDPERLAALSAECRFGFGQALRAWPGNEAARRGLQDCLTALFERAMSARDVGLAESLLAELPRLDAELQARVSALREELLAREAKLRELESEGDWRKGAAPRLLFFFGVLGVAVALWLWANEGSVRMERTLTPFELAGAATAVLALLGVMALVGRPYLFTTQANRRLVQGVLITGVMVVLGRWANCLTAPPTATVISGEVLLGAYGTALGALLLARWLWLAVPFWVAAVFATRLLPEYAGAIFAGAALCSIAVCGWKLQALAPGADPGSNEREE